MDRPLASKDVGHFVATLWGGLPFDPQGKVNVEVPINDRMRSFHLEVVDNAKEREIGWAEVTFWLRKTDFKTFSIDEIWLDETSSAYCGRGLGSWLVSLFETWAREFGAEVMTAELSKRRLGMRGRANFFSKNGYTILRQSALRQGDPPRFVVYKKLVPEARVPREMARGRVVRDLRRIA